MTIQAVVDSLVFVVAFMLGGFAATVSLPEDWPGRFFFGGLGTALAAAGSVRVDIQLGAF